MPALDFPFDSVNLNIGSAEYVPFNDSVNFSSIEKFYNKLLVAVNDSLLKKMLWYKEYYNLDDWLYYQLIRKLAQCVSPKGENYNRYTLYKWFLMMRSGYDCRIKISGEKILLYVQSNEDVFEIPCYKHGDTQYVCLNYHDFNNNINFAKEIFTEIHVDVPQAKKPFSYRVKSLPNFEPRDYSEKTLHFRYSDDDYVIKLKYNKQVNLIFANYPVVDYESCFNIPLSKETYESLIPALQQNVKYMNIKNGVDYLMRFTRYSFLYRPDTEQFGKEKRMTPEQTLMFNESDCEDRAALFYMLVKEIYNLPMIVLVYPMHVTVAVKFDRHEGTPII
jgi:hypothetical protein